MAVNVAHDGVAVATGLFLPTFVVRMVFRNGVSGPFPGVWKRSVSGISANVAVTRLCGFPSVRGGLPATCRRVRVVTRLHIYAYLGADFTGTLLVAPAHIPGSYRSVLTLYHAIRGTCSLPVYSGRSGAVYPVQPWLPCIRRSCIALGGLSTDIEFMVVRRFVTVPSSGYDVTGHWGFSIPDRRLKA